MNNILKNLIIGIILCSASLGGALSCPLPEDIKKDLFTVSQRHELIDKENNFLKNSDVENAERIRIKFWECIKQSIKSEMTYIRSISDTVDQVKAFIEIREYKIGKYDKYLRRSLENAIRNKMSIGLYFENRVMLRIGGSVWWTDMQ